MRAPARRLLFTATIFAGSFLLFLIQPMVARIALPRLGGAPAVWNSAMLVYQALLLGGYAYAHWLARHSARTQAVVHVSACAIAAVLLPIGLSAAAQPPDISAFLWVPWLLLSSIGPLFFLVSANAPLLQRWFAWRGGGDPYPLFAASNLGSFAGLIAYPLLLEPLMPVSAQRLLWTAGYGVLLALLLACAFQLTRGDPLHDSNTEGRQRPRLRRIFSWIWLAFIPSGLMLSTTLFITTDIMPMPLLWVVPLSLYLLSFTIAFSTRGRIAGLLAIAAPYLLVPAGIALFIGEHLPLAVTAAILLAALFAISVACHLRIYRSRPDPDQLTAFYLAVALGGALGGLFCALIAPLIFDWTYEYPLLLIAAAITLLPGYSPLLPNRWLERAEIRRAALASAALILVSAVIAVAVWQRNSDLVRYGSFAAILVGSLAVGSRLLLISTMLAGMIFAGAWMRLERSIEPGRMTRTYFGIYSVVDSGASRQLMHGTTLHGIQLLTPGWERFATTYYGRESGVGRALELAPRMFGPNASVSVVGLGAGTLACYKQQHQRWTFFELDPAVVELATKSRWFTFLERCAPEARIIIGDARLKLAKEPPGAADVLVVDAFSSDAIPLHLLTREAFALYGRYLKSNGLLLVHISNRHLDLEPVVSAPPGWQARFGQFSAPWDYRHLTTSHWMALSRSAATIDALSSVGGDAFWQPATERRLLWTDDHASLLSAFK
jgi:spermidine synthase